MAILLISYMTYLAQTDYARVRREIVEESLKAPLLSVAGGDE